MAVAAHPEHHEVERPASRRPAGGPSERRVAASCAAHQSAPSPRPIASPVGNGCRLPAGSGTSTAPPAVPSSVRPIPSRMSSSGLTFESGWSRGTNRSSPHQTWMSAHGTVAIERRLHQGPVDPDRRRAAGRRPVGAAARGDRVARATRRIRSAASRRGGRGVGHDPDLGLRLRPASSLRPSAGQRRGRAQRADRRPGRAVRLRWPRRAGPPRSAAGRRKCRSSASTPSCQTRTWTVSASAVTSARSSEPRRSASSSTRRVVPAGIVETIGRTTHGDLASGRPTAWPRGPGRSPAWRPDRGSRGGRRRGRGRRPRCERLDHRQPEPRRQPAARGRPA